MLRDLDGDNVAIVDTRAVASGENAQLLTLAAEWRYDEYGSVHWSRIHGPHPVLACGHRGVFFDRLNEPVIRFAAEAAWFCEIDRGSKAIEMRFAGAAAGRCWVMWSQGRGGKGKGKF